MPSVKESSVPEGERAFLNLNVAKSKWGPKTALAKDPLPGCVFLLLVRTGQQEGAAVVLGSSYPGTEGRGQAGRAVLGGSTETGVQMLLRRR